ncbi:hypothetical protein COT12_00800 [Candidatus Berkelbacteria bacterium CG08_land_8_20_14_0_20_39_8]|uniref:Uncharacterized protein n=1 Tax=Candidatus Berkelbacteria bacterium CG08_land_8_20_14_0_20_39_8 TaxID=1974511 RepID=A0A2M6YCP5_9BACT|nr:MAG: hypothetical protein COT12_00800 [Candidatus Berkelbacteria bacterium CG08_land_8_20_14_0_20_39_8]
MGSEQNKIAGNVVSQIAGRLVVLIMSLVTIKLISNYAGTEGTGYYNTIITYLTFFITIADFGLFSIGVREISKHPEKHRQYLDNIFTIRLISALAVTLIAVGIAQLTNYDAIIKQGVLIASIFLFFNLLGSVFDLIFQVRLEMRKVALAEIIGKILTLGSLALIVAFKMSFNWIIATVSLSTVVSIFVKYFLAANDEIPHLSWDKKIISQIINLSLPFGMIFILNNFYFKVDTLILFYFKGASQVGIYAIAYRVLETTIFAASYLSYSLKPLLSSSIDSDKERSAKAVSRGLVFLFSMSLIIVVVCLPFSRQIILFLSNSDFLAGAPVLVVLAFASIFIYSNTLISEILIAKDERRYLLIMAVSILLFNVISNIILIPIYSFYAAAATTLASEILMLTIGFLKIRKIIPLQIDFVRLGKLLLSATVAIFISFGLNIFGLYFILSIMIGISIYALLAYTIDAVPKEMVKDYLTSLRSKWTH